MDVPTAKFLIPTIKHLVSADEVLILKKAVQVRDKHVLPFSFRSKENAFTLLVKRDGLPFSSLERAVFSEFTSTLNGFYRRFDPAGMLGQFRTALTTSVADTSIARYLRARDKHKYWPIQQLIQLMKQLSFKRYEGDPATSGFVVYRRRTDTFRGLLSHTGFSWKSLDDIHTIDVNFFENPLSYRFVDGIHSVYASDIKMNTHGTVLLEKVLSLDAVDRLSHRATAELLKAAGKKSFGIFVNETSEVEIVLPNDRLVVWRNGFWSIFDPRLFRVFLANLLDEDVLDSLVWTTYALSKTRHGTVILVGDIGKKALSELKAGDVAGRNRVSKGLIGNLKNEKLTGLKEQGLLFGSLSSDGLTVLDRNGKLIDTGVIVDTSRGTEKDDKQKEGGGRTAAAKAASVYGKVIKVSEDGPIEFYEDKQRLCRLG